MERLETVRSGPFRVQVVVSFLLMLCACGPWTTIKRSDEKTRDSTGTQAGLLDPEQYEVMGYGTIDLHRRSLPHCFYDTIRTVLTEEKPSRKKAIESLVSLAALYRGRAVIHVTTESLVVRTTTPGSHGKAGKDPTYDSEGRPLTSGSLPQPGSRGDRITNMKYKCRGTVVRCRETK